MAQKGTPIEGQACEVTSGPNKGKKGKYTRDDEGNLWCESDWGGTQCNTGKCKDAKAQVSIFEYVATDGTVVNEVGGLFEVEGRGIFDCNAIINADTGETRKISAVPIASTSLKDVRESESEIERRVAGLIESHLEGGRKG